MKRFFRFYVLALLAISFLGCNHDKDRTTPTPHEDPIPVLTKLTIHEEEVKEGKVTVKNDKTTVKTKNVTATFNIANVDVKVKNEPVVLEEGKETDVTILVPAVKGKYKAIRDIVVKVTRKKAETSNPIMIKGWYVDDNLVLDPTKEYSIDKDSCTVKITVLKEYANVKIDGEDVSYVAGSTATELGSYSKKIQGIAKGSMKSVAVTITDASHNNSPFIKTIKIKHEDASSYAPTEIKRIDVGDEMYTPASSVNGKIQELTEGVPLSLSVFFKKNVPAGKEKLRFVVGDGVGDKTQEKPVKGLRVDCSFASITQGEYDVKIERLVKDEVKDTFNFKVKYQAKLEKISVKSINISDEKNTEGVTFKKAGGIGTGNKPLSELERADEAHLYEYIFSEGEKISVKVFVETPSATLEYRVGGSGTYTSMANDTKTDINIPNGIHLVEIKITKVGFKDALYKFKTGKKALMVTNVTIGSKSYTWSEFSALTEAIKVAENKITISGTWENDEELTPTLKRKNVEFSMQKSGKTATWKDITLEAGINNFEIKFYIVGLPWKKKNFKIEKTGTESSNVNISDTKIFGFSRINIAKPRIEWPFGKEGMTEFDLYVKPESTEVKGIKMKSPSEATLSKITGGTYDGYYMVNLNISSGKKIEFEVEAKDGSKKTYFIDKDEKLTESASSITLKSFITNGNVYYDTSLPSKRSPKKPFDNASFLVEIPVSESKIYLMFNIEDYPGMNTIDDLDFAEGINLEGFEQKPGYHECIISYDTSKMQIDDVKNIEIHLTYKPQVDKTVDLFQFAKYTIKLIKKA